MNPCATLSLRSILLLQSQRVEMTEFVAFFGSGVRSNCRLARWDKAKINKVKEKNVYCRFKSRICFRFGHKM